jgi:hypothetical protein
MIGQMQGKFQMVVVPGVGHMLQEVMRLYFMRSSFCFIQYHPSGRPNEAGRDFGRILET